MEVLKNFIVLEGLDGSGTTTQLKLLSELKSIKIHTSCEPTGGPAGRLIRKILGSEEYSEKTTLAYLFAADRNEHLNGKNGIREKINEGFLCVSDRYFFSSLAYQAPEVGFELVRHVNALFPLPEKLIFIEADPETCFKRIQVRESKEIYEKLDYLKTVNEFYKKSFDELAGRTEFYRIDGTLPIEEVHKKICGILDYK
jgi:dTMP kinase